MGLAATALCGASRNSPIHNVRPPDAEMLLEEGGVILLDVRTPKEFAAGHIPSATSIPITELSKRLQELPADKTQPILLYCTVGERSSKAAKILARNGYKDIYNLTGGINAWTREQKPIEKPTVTP